MYAIGHLLIICLLASQVIGCCWPVGCQQFANVTQTHSTSQPGTSVDEQAQAPNRSSLLTPFSKAKNREVYLVGSRGGADENALQSYTWESLAALCLNPDQVTLALHA
jgi:hypothetical protein